MFCSHCGNSLSDGARFCTACGHQVAGAADTGYASPITPYADRLSVREQTSGTIWLVISVIQLLIGVFGLWVIFIVGILNLLGAIGSFHKAKQVRVPYPGMVQEYEKQLTSLIIALIYNILIGGVIGVIGNIYDFSTRSYVLNNRELFERYATVPAPQLPR